MTYTSNPLGSGGAGRMRKVPASPSNRCTGQRHGSQHPSSYPLAWFSTYRASEVLVCAETIDGAVRSRQVPSRAPSGRRRRVIADLLISIRTGSVTSSCHSLRGLLNTGAGVGRGGGGPGG